MAEIKKKITPRDILRIVFRRWRLFFGSATLFAVTTLIAAHYLPLKYTSMTKFERRSDPSNLESRVNETEGWGQRKYMLGWDMLGPHALSQAAEELELTRGMPHGPDGQLTDDGQLLKQELLEKLRRCVGLDWDVNTPAIDLISVKVTHEDPLLAKNMADVLVKNYINRLGEQMIQSLRSSKEFLEAQVKAQQDLLQQTERKRMDFERQHYNSMPQEPGMLMRSIEDTKLQLDMVRRQAEIVHMKLVAMQAYMKSAGPTTQPAAASVESAPTTQPALLAGGPTTQPALAGGPTTQPVSPYAGMPYQITQEPNPQFMSLLSERENLKETRTRELLTMKPAHPKIKDIETRIGQTEDRIKKMVEKGEQFQIRTTYFPNPDPIMKRMLEQEAEVSDGQVQRLEAKLTKYESSLANFERTKQEYDRIQKQIRGQETELAGWTGRLESVTMNLQGEIAKRRSILMTVQVAEKQVRPSDPSLVKVLGAALAGGLAVAAFLVFLANLLDRSIATPEDAKQFGVPVHGIIGEIVTRQRRRSMRMRRWILAPIVGLVVLGALGGSILSISLSLTAPDEYRRFQSARLDYLQDKVVSKVQGILDKAF